MWYYKPQNGHVTRNPKNSSYNSIANPIYNVILDEACCIPEVHITYLIRNGSPDLMVQTPNGIINFTDHEISVLVGLTLKTYSYEHFTSIRALLK